MAGINLTTMMALSMVVIASMIGAYGWAFSKPLRKLYYNITITAASDRKSVV